jgi:hypothetical protein
LTRPTPDERPTARQLADQANESPQQIAGKPADVCPYCGCGMFVDGTRNFSGVVIHRYVNCRNKACGRRFVSKQPPAVLLREIDDNADDSSSSGRSLLSVFRKAC